MFLSPSTQWLAVTSQRPSRTRWPMASSKRGLCCSTIRYTLAWLWLKTNSGNSSMRRRTVVKVSFVVATVSGHDHIQFMSMCACPTQ